MFHAFVASVGIAHSTEAHVSNGCQAFTHVIFNKYPVTRYTFITFYCR